ncbi:acyl CoA:acetate/3-ketoacid CoA transferase [Providencia alcalifaciens]|uniref:acyl CoA:acetate/3-ketoacid CoA transferase n=1 Tax=Providencia alcalifaciens TaxID=126385 RepID=UPI002B054588|nr:CoA-transferase [Providencia alcalifaciens]
MKRVNFISAEEAASHLRDNDHVILGGFIGAAVPEAIEREVGIRFQREGHPRNLSIYFTAGQGDGDDKSVNHMAQEELVSFVIAGHWGLSPKLQALAMEEKIRGYNLPQGVIAQLMRDSASGKPGTISHVGLGTFVDPRLEGGKINALTTEEWVEVVTIGGEECLFYKKIPGNIALLRGTTADEHGNITMEDECLLLDNLAIAQLVKNNGGRVIVQVKNRVPAGTLKPHDVRIPGIYVDDIVLVNDLNDHMQTFAEVQNDCYSNPGLENISSPPPVKMDARKIIARRAAMELREGAVLNLGIGVPEVIAAVAHEEGLSDQLLLTVEPGAIGGTPAGGLSFGASSLPDAIITQDQQFDFYDGGGLDQAFLGLAECDRQGNLNVSRFGPKIAGCGGFIDITQNTRNVYFCGTFMAGKSDIQIKNGKLKIVRDGTVRKFIHQVQQITFSGEMAIKSGKTVLYITERAVFRLTREGLELTEIAPGVDLQQDILEQMDFVPAISPSLKVMDAALFHEGPMSLTLQSPSETKR